MSRGRESPSLVQEDDRINRAGLVTSLGAGTGVAAVLLILALWLTRRTELDLRPTNRWPEAEERPRPAVVTVLGRPYDAPSPALRADERARQQLSSYGWVSREQRTVHIPIERAMELVALGVRP